jgi:hypothetical protein
VVTCQRCHAPLSEQFSRLDNGKPNPHYNPGLRKEGITCAVCHVRKHVRTGPDPGYDRNEDAFHNSFEIREEYTSPAFCATCHDFRPEERKVNDKLLQETTEEWRRTKFAKSNLTCQYCHMPQKRHLFKGIHDSATVRSALHMKLTVSNLGKKGSRFKGHPPIKKDTMIMAELTIANRAVGHRLPTYTTPQITLIIEQADTQGVAIKDTRVEGAIARRLTQDLSKELFDTRLLPGEEDTLFYDFRRHKRTAFLIARVEVWPDEHYRRFFKGALENPAFKTDPGLPLLKEAYEHAKNSRYVLWEEKLGL